MADMADIAQVEEAWEVLADAGVAERTVPVTYMNSTAAIKAFTGRHGGTVCTSSNAQVALRWAFDKTGGPDGDGKVLFMPDQHLGRNTAVLELGLSLDDCVVYDPRKPRRRAVPREQLRDARMILWRGHCSVHGRFSAGQRHRDPRARAGRQRAGAPRVQARGGRRRGPRRLDRAHHPRPGRRRAGQRVGDRHRAQPGAPARRRPPAS